MTDPLDQIVEETRTYAATSRRIDAALRAAGAAGATPQSIASAMRRAQTGRPDFRQPIDELIDRRVTPPVTPFADDSEPMHAWFGLSYANYLVLHRTLLQSMPQPWQARFVTCLAELSRAFEHVEQVTRYDVRCLAREPEHISSEDCPTCDGEGLVLDGGLPVEPEQPCPDCDGDGQIDADRVETPEEVGVITDPVPHYNRGRARIEPAT